MMAIIRIGMVVLHMFWGRGKTNINKNIKSTKLCTKEVYQRKVCSENHIFGKFKIATCKI